MVKTKDFEFITVSGQAHDSENKNINAGAGVMVLNDSLFPLYIVTGDKTFLVDTGPATRAPIVYERICKVLAENLTGAGTGTIDTLLLTHSHWDHTGASYYLQQQFHYDVYSSPRTAYLIVKDKVIDLINFMNREYKELTGGTADIAFQSLEKISAVEEGATIPVGPGPERYFQVFDTPGHTKCSTSFLLHPEKILFCGDAAGLMGTDGVIRPLFFSNYEHYESSIEKLLSLDAEVLAFPHNRLVKSKERVQKVLQNSLEQTRYVKEKIASMLAEGREVRDVAEAIYRDDFPHVTFIGSHDTLVANIETMVKIVARGHSAEG